MSESDDENRSISNSTRIGLRQMKAMKFMSLDNERSTNKLKLDDALVEFINHKFEEMELTVHRKVKNAKDSILYNIEHKMEELKLTFVASNNPRIPNQSVQALMAAIKTPLPITHLDDFIEFERAVNEEPEKKDALIALFHYLCFEFPTAHKCIENVLPRVFKKAVQWKYSGQGKEIKGIRKLDFSPTATFTCFQVAIIAKFEETEESKNLKSKIGAWLRNFADREGGRKDRSISVGEE